MSVHRFGAEKVLRTRLGRAVSISSFIGVFVLMLSVGLGGRIGLAQTEDPAAAAPVPEPATAVPSPPSANAKPKQAAMPEAPKPEAATSAPPVPTQPAKPLNDNQKAVADASANLLELANSLKKEVDKTTADTLSVAVVRKASEIEQLARKMRGQ